MRIETIGDATLYCGDCLEILPTLEAGSVDALITDPPYSSGGAFRGDRMMATTAKYVNSEDATKHQEFSGDNRDQRAYLLWCSLWLGVALRKTKPGAVACMFTDWRQLPVTTDALQCGGWVWRGIVPWNKTEGVRPQLGRFRQQCEYVVWGSAGPLSVDRLVGVLPGFYQYMTMNINNGKEHIAEKPIELMVDILQITTPAACVLDPFMGSGTTGVAALRLGRKFIGIEIEPRYFDIACRRIEQENRQLKMF